MMKSLQFKDKQGNKKYSNPYWPVGSIYMSISSINPTKWFGGTWQQIAKGRTLVGVDPNDNDFKTVKKTGGEKTHKLTINEIPKHRHNLSRRQDAGSPGPYELLGQNGGGTIIDVGMSETGGDQPHNNLQPYFTCYIWQRTA